MKVICFSYPSHTLFESVHFLHAGRPMSHYEVRAHIDVQWDRTSYLDSATSTGMAPLVFAGNTTGSVSIRKTFESYKEAPVRLERSLHHDSFSL